MTEGLSGDGRARGRELAFCACAPGLEELLRGELSELGLEARAVPGGVEARGEDAAARASLCSRLSEAVHLRLWEGASQELAAGMRRAARLAGPLPLLVRSRAGRATVSVDAVGSPLFRRGWRQAVGAAPLRETLAAALLRAAGWRGDRPLCDPMCGSGTIAIEAALIAAGRAPGLDRPLALEALPGRDRAGLERLRGALRAAVRPVEIPIHASDRNAGVLRLARRNAEAAGVAEALRLERCDAREAPLPAGPGLCAVNPPFGLRLPEGAADAWRALGALAARLAGWDLVVLGPDRGLERLLGLGGGAALPVRNGGLACAIHLFERLPAADRAGRPPHP